MTTTAKEPTLAKQLVRWRRAKTLLAMVALLVVASPLDVQRAIAQMPEPALKVPTLVPEQSVSTLIPSEAAPGQGLAINIIYPDKPRYADGAPIAVMAPGGAGPDGLRSCMHAAQVGFAEVRLAFPGGGKQALASGGIYDYRGGASQLAFKDVLLFAAGKSVDNHGRHIQDLVPVKLSGTNIGIVGWSNGGNIALVTMAKCPEDLGFLKWVAFYESPVGAMFFPPNLGGDLDLIQNRRYRQGSCATGNCIVDYRNLTFDPNMRRHPGEHHRKGEPEIAGVLFFDENRNGKWEESAEYAFSYALDVGLEKQIYPPDVISALQRLNTFTRWREIPEKRAQYLAAGGKGKDDEYEHGDHDRGGRIGPKGAEAKAALAKAAARQAAALKAGKGGVAAPPSKEIANLPANVVKKGDKFYERADNWPPQLATLPESEAYYQERDGSLYIAEITAKYPNLLITVFGSQIDHLQRQPDHPHIALLYNAFLANKAKWLRLNPEPCYVSHVCDMNISNFANNKPNSPIDASNIGLTLEPEGMIPDYVFMEAAIAELADRARAKNFASPLPALLTKYLNTAQAKEEAIKAFGTAKPEK